MINIYNTFLMLIVQAFNKACCSRTSSELLEDINKENGHNDTCPTEQVIPEIV